MLPPYNTTIKNTSTKKLQFLIKRRSDPTWMWLLPKINESLDDGSTAGSSATGTSSTGNSATTNTSSASFASFTPSTTSDEDENHPGLSHAGIKSMYNNLSPSFK